MLINCMNTYLSLRRAAGFKLDTVEVYLRSYAIYATIQGDSHIVSKTAIDWAAKAPSDNTRAIRLQQVIRFARFARAKDPRHEIPPGKVFCKRPHRRKPYFFTDQEIARLLHEASNLGPKGSLRPHTYSAIFGLLAATGLRISEALNLCFDDVTADGLVIRKTKFKKSRLVPLHETAMAALCSYLEHRRRRASHETHIFVSHRGGKPLGYSVVASTFQPLRYFVWVNGEVKRKDF